MRKLSCILSLWIVGSACADNIYVPDDQPTIQIAISEAHAEDIIILQPGVYYEAISFGGKRITIQSIDPLDSAIAAATVIDALDLGAVVTFLGSEDETSIIGGVTIQGGQIGIQGNGCTAFLYHVIVQSNGIGIDQFNGNISNSVIKGNSNYGIKNSKLIVFDTQIINNLGYGVYSDSSINGNLRVYGCYIANNNYAGIYLRGNNKTFQIIGSTISHNHATGIQLDQSLSSSANKISRSLISGNWEHGIAEFPQNATLDNSIIAGNKGNGIVSAGNGSNIVNCDVIYNKGTGIYAATGTIKQCALWNNQFPIALSSTPTFSRTDNPLFVQAGGWDLQNNKWIEGDYHIAADSQCIDAGDPFYSSDIQMDFEGNARISGPRIDIGAYEFQHDCLGPDFDNDGVPDACDDDIDNDGAPNSWDPCDFTSPGTEISIDGRPRADLNLDCVVNLADFAILQRSMGD